MSYHSFSLDPRTVLGVGPDASLDEIRDAYRVKSKKHHPDLGGDEWAFRMVTRAYEVLKTTEAVASSQSWDTHVADVGHQGQRLDWSRVWGSPFSKSGSACGAYESADKVVENAGGPIPDLVEEDQSETASRVAQSSITEPDKLHSVDVELIWTRFEKAREGRLLSTQEGDDTTLSVCMVISWPPRELIDCAPEFTSTGETLRSLIDLFAILRGQEPVINARSRIEDGQFVGWLSYVDVLTAQDAFLTFRDALKARNLTVKLYTRDERVPFDWYGASHQPVMSHAS
jgi:DnaJ domain